MGWKDWPYWIKGGILFLLLHTILILTAGGFCWDGKSGPLCNIPEFLTLGKIFSDFEYYYISLILYLLIGVMIGGIIGLVNQKAQSSSQKLLPSS